MSADSVIVVARRKKLGLLQRFYLPSILRALWITSRRLWRNLRRPPGDHRSGDGIVRYPEERAKTPAAFRGMPVLVMRSDGEPRCVACGRCGAACPTQCIRVRGNDDGSLRAFDIDMSRCIFCGACEEACDDHAIAMSSHVEVAAFDRDSLVFHLHDLLVAPEYVDKRLRFLSSAADRRCSFAAHGEDRVGTEEGQER